MSCYRNARQLRCQLPAWLPLVASLTRVLPGLAPTPVCPSTLCCAPGSVRAEIGCGPVHGYTVFQYYLFIYLSRKAANSSQKRVGDLLASPCTRREHPAHVVILGVGLPISLLLTYSPGTPPVPRSCNSPLIPTIPTVPESPFQCRGQVVGDCPNTPPFWRTAPKWGGHPQLCGQSSRHSGGICPPCKDREHVAGLPFKFPCCLESSLRCNGTPPLRAKLPTVKASPRRKLAVAPRAPSIPLDRTPSGVNL